MTNIRANNLANMVVTFDQRLQPIADACNDSVTNNTVFLSDSETDGLGYRLYTR